MSESEPSTDQVLKDWWSSPFYRAGLRTIAFSVDINEKNRPALELLFGCCLHCQEKVPNCTCHERGYN